MAAILDDLIKKANDKPVYGVFVGLFGDFFSESDEFQYDFHNHLDGDIVKEVKKRYGDRAFGFRRCCYLYGEQLFKDKGWVYFSGKVESKAEVDKRNSPDEEILRKNMEYNSVPMVIRMNGRTFPFYENDIVLNDVEG